MRTTERMTTAAITINDMISNAYAACVCVFADSHCPSQPVVVVPGRAVQLMDTLPSMTVPMLSMIATAIKAPT